MAGWLIILVGMDRRAVGNRDRQRRVDLSVAYLTQDAHFTTTLPDTPSRESLLHTHNYASYTYPETTID